MGVRQARPRLPTVLRLVAEGQPVMLSRRGKPAAVVLPAGVGEVWQRDVGGWEAGPQRDRRATTAGEPVAGDGGLGGRCPGRLTGGMRLLWRVG